MSSVNDRRFALVHKDKGLRMAGASWVEMTGSAVLFDDFVGDTIASDNWAITSPQATGGTDWAINNAAGFPTAGHGGWIAATTGTADNDNEVINGDGIWAATRAGNGMLTFQTAFTLPSIAGIAAQGGFTDAVNELPFSIGGSDAITSTASDAAAFILDVDADTDDFFGVNVDSDTDGTLVTLEGTPAADTLYIARIEIDSSGSCYYYFGSTLDGSGRPAYKGQDTVGVTPTVLLLPYLNVKATAGAAAKSMEADYVLVACAR